MKLLITGAKGFIGKNLVAELNNIKDGKTKLFPFLNDLTIYEFDVDTLESQFDEYCRNCDFVIHLAGINRPERIEEFMNGNFGFTTKLLEALKKNNNKSPILMSSSIQAELDNDYGKSKKAGEDYLRQYGIDNDIKTYIFRMPNVFGKWCKPNYNSVVATFCNNLASGLPIRVDNRETELTLVYVDDVVSSFLEVINGNVNCTNGFCKIFIEYKATLGHIANTLQSFVDSRITNYCPCLKDNSFEKKLYATYLSYLPKVKFSYPLKMNVDNRGSFTEFLKTPDYGQISVNISKPHIIKGNHWHNTKNEKFLVVSGNGIIRFRKIDEDTVLEYYVCGDKLEVVDIPPGYTHNIENLGNTDMVTIMWASECFDPQNPDTYFMEV